MYSLDNGNIQLYHGDCLEVMPTLPEKSIDMILADLPYGTTACKWDSIIPFDILWRNYTHLLNSARCVALFGSEPFSSTMRVSNLNWYKYDWIWDKSRASGFVHAKNKPMKRHEIVSIFSNGTTVHKTQSKNRMIYNPQMGKGKPYTVKHTKVNSGKINHAPTKSNFDFVGTTTINTGERYPQSILAFTLSKDTVTHPTQKPVALMEYLIKTYTNAGDIVLDNTMGSGTTGVACINTNRRFIGIEMDETYFQIAVDRCTKALQDKAL